MERALFAAGCFWGVEKNFQDLYGVYKTSVGYSGGHKKKPTYEEVCAGQTGHAEVVLMEFDSKVISYKALLRHFWSIHDPTTLNRQGLDRGTQYRSAIYFYTRDQEEKAKVSLKERQSQLDPLDPLGQKIVTEVTKATEFYRAEEYHQCYLKKR